MKLKYEEIRLYCKSYDSDKRECKGRAVSPTDKPADMKCRWFKKSEDAKFTFGDGGIRYYEETPWSRYKRDKLKERYARILKG